MSERLKKVDNLIKQEVSGIIQTEIDNPKIGFVTITRVATTVDLREAKVYVSIMADEESKADCLLALNKSAGYIRGLLASRIKLKFIPYLRFYKDDTMDEVARVEQILKKIKSGDSQKNENNK